MLVQNMHNFKSESFIFCQDSPVKWALPFTIVNFTGQAWFEAFRLRRFEAGGALRLMQKTFVTNLIHQDAPDPFKTAGIVLARILRSSNRDH